MSRNPAAPGQLFTPVQIHHLLRLFNYGHERFDFQYHVPLLRLLAAASTAGLFRWKMLVPIPNPFFFSMGKFVSDLYRHKHKLFLDVKPW